MTPLILAAAAVVLSGPVKVTDGDTIRAGSERIRLLGIDAPEIHGCRRGRVCAPGDGQAAKRALGRYVQKAHRISITRVGTDRYGRTLAVVYAGRVNLSCQMLRAGQAVYVAKWDDGGRVRSACPEVVR